MKAFNLRQGLIGLAIVSTVVVSLSLLLSREAVSQAAPAPAKPALTVNLVNPEPRVLPRQLAVTGSVAAWQEASVGAEVNGLRLAEVHVNVGDSVRKGQLLASFADQTLRAELAQIRAALAEAEAALALAQADAQRARELQGTGAISAQQIKQLLVAEQTAQARLQAQQANLALQELRLAQTRVIAPDDGLISARNATVGAVVPSGHELFRLIRQSRLEWRAEVPAADLGLLKNGMTARLQGPAGETIEGRLRMVAPTVDARTRNALVYVDLPRPGALKAGMFARGSFELGRSEALTVPQSAVLLREGFSFVMTVDAESRVREQKVVVGRRDGDRVEILEGLTPAARVVASGAAFLGDGDTVRVTDAPAK
jgi:RND family efflux transporter MFP subunit